MAYYFEYEQKKSKEYKNKTMPRQKKYKQMHK